MHMFNREKSRERLFWTAQVSILLCSTAVAIGIRAACCTIIVVHKKICFDSIFGCKVSGVKYLCFDSRIALLSALS